MFINYLNILIDEAVKRLGIEKNITIYTIPLNDAIYIIFFLTNCKDDLN